MAVDGGARFFGTLTADEYRETFRGDRSMP